MKCPMRRDPMTQEFGDCVEECAWRVIIENTGVGSDGRLKYRKMAVCAVASMKVDEVDAIPMEEVE